MSNLAILLAILPCLLETQSAAHRGAISYSERATDVYWISRRHTAQACGYSEAEKLARLQRCLKRNAREAVRSRLLLPEVVPHVIATLETLLGRPELLIHTLLQKIRGGAEPLKSPRSWGHHAHLNNNPMLFFELVDILPANMKQRVSSSGSSVSRPQRP